VTFSVFILTLPSPVIVTSAPISRRMSSETLTSFILGKFSISHTPRVTMLASITAPAAFFIPSTLTRPFSGRPPSIMIFSIYPLKALLRDAFPRYKVVVKDGRLNIRRDDGHEIPVPNTSKTVRANIRRKRPYIVRPRRARRRADFSLIITPKTSYSSPCTIQRAK
jgi:hypothetical protein